MQYQVTATMPTTGEVIIIEVADSLPHAEAIARRYKLTLKTDWIVSIEELPNVVTLAPAEYRPGVFADVTERNKRNEQRLTKARNEANKSVLRQYRIVK